MNQPGPVSSYSRADHPFRTGDSVSGGLRLAGMHKLTTLDYPGLVSAIVFTQGCNFHCPYCHNAHLIPEQSRAARLTEEEVLAFLHKRADLLDGLVISGGEPTLHAGLADFCREVKALGYAVKLDTNGSRPDVIETLLNASLLDYLAIDCKTAPQAYAPDFTSDADMGDTLAKTAALVRASGLEHEFRTTCVAPYVSETHLEPMLALVQNSPWFWQRARLDVSMREKGLAPLNAQEMTTLAQAATRHGPEPVLR